MARDISQLHPQAKALADKLITACKAEGLLIKITDCVRNREEQDALYAQGRTLPGNKVTNVRYPNSMHNWGIAFDFCRNDGRGAYEDSDGFFSRIGEIGKRLGLEWGGDWKSPVDKPHFQLAGWGSTPARLVSTYGIPEAYRKTWENSTSTENTGSTTGSNIENKNAKTGGRCNVTVSMPVLKKGSNNNAVRIWQYIVGEKADGIFGKNTLAKTKAFQKKKGLVEDGIVGAKSWKAGLSSL